MKAVKDNEFPPLPEFGGKYEKISPDQISQIGQNVSAFALRPGDVIEFWALRDAKIFARPLSEGSTIMVGYAGCLRNSKPSFVPIGAFTRKDVNRKPIHDLSEKCQQYANFKEIYENELANKTLYAGGYVSYKAQKYDSNNSPVKGETIDKRECAILDHKPTEKELKEITL